jgi:hypothetical protein
MRFIEVIKMSDINATYTGFLLDMLPKSGLKIMFSVEGRKTGFQKSQNYVIDSLRIVLNGETTSPLDQGEYPVSRDDLTQLLDLANKGLWEENFGLYDNFLGEAYRRADKPYKRPGWLQKILSGSD